MRDPFKPHTNHQLIREAQFGFTVIGLLVATLIYVAWFRLSGLHDRLPEDIRSSPIAMQVYPNSPNYDSESNQMRTTIPAPQQISNPRSKRPPQALVEVPRKLMTDSQRSARRLSQDAASIDRSVTRVATLLKPTKLEPAPIKPPVVVEPIRKIDAGPKIEPSFAASKKESMMLPPATIKPPVRLHPTTAPPAPAPKSNDFKAFKPKQAFKPTASPASTDFKPSKPRLFSPFKSSSTSAPKKAAPTGLPAFEPAPVKPAAPRPLQKTETSTRPSFPSLAPHKLTPKNLTPAQLPPLQPTKPVPQPISNFKTSDAPKTPTVQTVSFESTTWKVKQGDSFWSIAQQSYGDGRFFRALYESNRKEVPGFENLREDIELNIPSKQQLISQHSSLCPTDAVHRNDPWRATPEDLLEDLDDSCDTELSQRFYETKAKDTLFSIAQRQLGQASRYVELLELNRFRIPADSDHQTLLPASIQLLLPQQ